MTFTRPALALIALGLAGTAYALRPRPARLRGTPSPYNPVRNAGTEEMTLPMRRWDLQDETSDQSFPASDPPANY